MDRGCILEKLLTICENVSDIIRWSTPEFLGGEQIVGLRRLLAHFNAAEAGPENVEGENVSVEGLQEDEEDQEDPDGEETEDGARSRSGRGKQRKKPTPPMLRLAKDIDVPKSIVDHIATHGTDAKTFLAGVDEKFMDHVVSARRDDDMGAVYHHYVHYLEGLTQRSTTDAACKAFMWLFFFDLAQKDNETNNTRHTGRRTGARMQESMVAQLGDEFFRMMYTGVHVPEIAQAKAKVGIWTRRGKKVSQLCDSFGEGFVLMAAAKLSEDL